MGHIYLRGRNEAGTAVGWSEMAPTAMAGAVGFVGCLMTCLAQPTRFSWGVEGMGRSFRVRLPLAELPAD
jgi:hypothetical protein